METFIQLVSNLGFPIAMCAYMAWQNNELSKAHRAETKEFTEALNKNTLILQKLCDALNIEREDK